MWNVRLGVALVGAVEAGTLEGYADGVVALAQGFFAALRADAQCLVAKGLALFKDVVAILALVNVDRHFVLLYRFSLGWFITWFECTAFETLGAICVFFSKSFFWFLLPFP